MNAFSKDNLWQTLVSEAKAREDVVLSDLLHKAIFPYDSLEQALSYHLAYKLGDEEITTPTLAGIFNDAFVADDSLITALHADLLAVCERDPACRSCLDAFLFFKGFLALQNYRVAHFWLEKGQRSLALYLQNRASEVFGVDIHPAAVIGQGIMMDHATGIVIGETAKVGNDVSMLHGVTLGGSGKEEGDRHPKIGDGVLISVGAKVLGNIRVGKCAKIGAGSVVLTDVPAYSTAVGVPAKIVGKSTAVDEPLPSQTMDHSIKGDEHD